MNRKRQTRLLGEGAFSQVYLAWDETGPRACKVSDNLKLLRNEAEYMKQLHSQVSAFPRFYGYREGAHLLGETADESIKGYLLMEYIEGKHPLTYLRSIPTATAQVQAILSIGIQLCDILTVLHGSEPRLVFRDLKPDNLLIDSDGRVRLIDLGLLGPEGSSTAQTGTPGFAAPEQFEPGSYIDPTADIYGLGKTLETLCKTTNSKVPPRPKQLSHPFRTQLECPIALCTAKDPAERIPSAGILRELLTSMQGTNPDFPVRDILAGKLIIKKSIHVHT